MSKEIKDHWGCREVGNIELRGKKLIVAIRYGARYDMTRGIRKRSLYLAPESVNGYSFEITSSQQQSLSKVLAKYNENVYLEVECERGCTVYGPFEKGMPLMRFAGYFMY